MNVTENILFNVLYYILALYLIIGFSFDIGLYIIIINLEYRIPKIFTYKIFTKNLNI